MTTAIMVGPHADHPRPGPLAPYETALRDGGPLYLVRTDGRREPLDVDRWKAAADTADETLLARCAGPTLDIGCGPGRLVAALVRRGTPALGIDLAATAVRLTVHAGGAALRRSVFDPLPGEGRWSSALLADGNIGIGGDPEALLTRTAALLRRDGVLLVETDPRNPDRSERFAARVEDAAGHRGTPFRWAALGLHALERLAPTCGFKTTGTWHTDDRAFAELIRIGV
ncbi:class I SAM-dependent methyltransferase [Yinghuangia seranimata]|uniref:class I SAM-dependent methyltransferase n=1 Tax=Yinghuangia seranimata TaxID=408067 RepID=UPI00248BDDC4|nr:methyltransferase domain-containing protein [Yinghuangia seranimata]MDI2132602.1 SAM-dependent methyltransferase [Yinghuangia seranimata]